MMPKLLLCLISICSLQALAGGASVVGNGAGLVEHNFQYAYTTLATTIRNCVSNNECGMTQKDNQLLEKILQVLEVNSQKPDRLVFVSEKDYPGFFETSPTEKHRIAKTGLDGNSSIYVNVDALYGADGKPLLDYSTIVSILAHELGHQSGEPDHALLDMLGAKLKRVVESKMAKHTMEVGEPSQSVEMVLINHSLPFKTAEAVFSWQGFGSRKITKELMEHVKCETPGTSLAGFEMQNGHYFFLEQSSQAETKLGFSLWIFVNCFNSVDLSQRLEKTQIRFRLNSDLKIELIDQIKLP